MAFAVTPTSGDGPYTVTATVANSENIDGVNYYATVGTDVGVGSCPLEGSSNLWEQFSVDLLLNTGTRTTSYPNVPAGSCRTLSLRIMRVYDNSVVAVSSASIDNV